MTTAVDAIRNNMIHLHERLSQTTPFITFMKTPHMARYESDYPSGLLNRILRYRKAAGIDPSKEIGMIADQFKNRGQISYWLSYADEEEDEIRAAFNANSFIKLDTFTGMALSLKDYQPEQTVMPGLEIKEIFCGQELEDYRQVVLSGFRIPPDIHEPFTQFFIHFGDSNKRYIQHYVAYFHGEPVCTLTAYLEDQVAGIYSVATLEPYRKKGIGRSVTGFALREMKARGAQLAVLTASAAGINVYKSIGFEEQVKIHLYSSQR